MPEFIQRNFTGGEVAPALHSRTDIAKYSSALRLCENFFVRAQGGVYSRPGLRFIADTGASTGSVRLIPFSFNTEQTYVLVFSNLKMHVIRNGILVEASAGIPFELTTPYTESQLFDLDYAQSADVMTIVHRNHAPMNLSRADHNQWTLAAISYTSSVPIPILAGNARTVAITAAAPLSTTFTNVATTTPHGLVTGNAVTFSGFTGDWTDLNTGSYGVIFQTPTLFSITFNSTGLNPAGVTGSMLTVSDRISTVGTGAGDFDKTYSYVVTAVNADGEESLPSEVSTITTKSLSTTAGVRIQWNAVTGAEKYRIYKDPSSGTSTYGFIGESSTLQFDDYNFAPITSDGPPSERTPFDGSGNMPSVVNYYQQRQVFANTQNEPQTTYTTRTNQANSLRTSSPVRDDDAVTFTIAASQVNEIRHIVSLGSMLLLTSGGEWQVTEGRDRVLTPSSVGVRIQSYNGASKVRPTVINNTVLYVQDKGARVRDLKFNFSDDGYLGNDLSLLAEHLFEGRTVVDMVYADEPYGILWCVMNDGGMLGLTYLQEQQVWGWHQHATDGQFLSVTSVSESGRDTVYAVVERTVEGQPKRYVERLEDREFSDPADAFYLDSGLSYSGTPVTTLSNLNHLEGRTVDALVDGNVVKGLTVTSGSVTVPRAGSKIHIGLPYTCTIETLDIDTPDVVNPLKQRRLSVSRVDVVFESTRGGHVGPIKGDGSKPLSEIKPRFNSDGYGTLPLRSYTADIRIEPDWNKGGAIRIEQRDPLPMTILAVIPDVSIGG